MEKILIPINEKLDGLKREIKFLRSPRRCPFYSMFGVKINCVYKDKWHLCHNVIISPGNGDAWCAKQINKSLGGKFATE